MLATHVSAPAIPSATRQPRRTEGGIDAKGEPPPPDRDGGGGGGGDEGGGSEGRRAGGS